MLWLDRLRVVLRTLRYRDAWGFRPRQSLGMLWNLRHMRPAWRGGEAEMNVYSPPVGGPAYARYLHGVQRMSHNQWTPLAAHISVTDRCPYPSLYRAPLAQPFNQVGCSSRAPRPSAHRLA